MKKILSDAIDAIAKVAGIAYCADDWGQVDNEANSPAQYPVRYPCALMAVDSSSAQVHRLLRTNTLKQRKEYQALQTQRFADRYLNPQDEKR